MADGPATNFTPARSGRPTAPGSEKPAHAPRGMTALFRSGAML
jgi:hypothetical protein